ncbi:MAG TPA: type II toxin-antitoxin system HicA family toxin [Candidatus Thermoplasmatota archaeon]|nr:type II toxin-antitoxin system HicA family toxin [Candidatus Thermoplasmatota archaeon]
MPKLPRDVSHARMVRFLGKHGWHIHREGSRHTLVSNGHVEIAIPRHQVLKTGTVAAILEQAGLRDARLEGL